MKNTGKTNRLFYAILFFIFTLFISCKKDPVNSFVGDYMGTVVHQYYEPRNTIPTIDTLFKNVRVIVRKGSESTSSEIRLALAYSDASISVPYSENIWIKNGVVKETYTNRGAIGTYYRWNGTITSGVMDLTHRVEQVNGSLHLFVINAVKQY